MSLSPTVQGIVVAIALVGAAVGAAMAGQLSDRFGRRRVILGAGVLFIAGAVISAVAPGRHHLLIGRFLVGLAIGVASMLTPLYLAEISPARDRGAIVSLNQLCITGGILVSYLVGYALASDDRGMALDARARGRCPAPCWRRHAGAAGKPALACRSRPDARRRGSAASPARHRRRSGRAQSRCAPTSRAKAGKLVRASELLAPRLRRRSIVGIGLAMFQQITGINTVIYFAPTIFQSAGLSSAATSILATAGVGAVNVIMTMVSIRLIDRLGRRQLLLWSLGGMAVTLFVLCRRV